MGLGEKLALGYHFVNFTHSCFRIFGIQSCSCAYFKAKAAYFMSCSDCFAQFLFHAFDVVLIAPLV